VPASHRRAILAEGGQPPGGYETVPDQRAGRPARAGEPQQAEEPRRPAAVLADRIATMLAHRETGWRLPRYTAMARRYHVSTAEIDAAIGELAARRLICRLPGGQVYRASPAEYLVPLEGVPGLASHVDPMGAELTCRSRQVSWRQVPDDIGRALGIPPPGPACVVSLRWTVNAEPAAVTVTYLPAGLTGPITTAYPAEGGQPEQEIGVVTGLNLLPLTARPERPEERRAALVPAGRAGALHFEMRLPPAAVARSLRLPAGPPAAMVAVRFDGPETGQPVALTFAAIRPALFRIVAGPAEFPLPDGLRECGELFCRPPEIVTLQ
jgi:DNA-binding GntR family transcriptional regulator